MRRTQTVGKSRNYTVYLVVSTLFVILVFSDTKWMFDMRQKGGWMGILSGNKDIIRRFSQVDPSVASP